MIREVFFSLSPFSHGPDPKQPRGSGSRANLHGPKSYFLISIAVTPMGKPPFLFCRCCVLLSSHCLAWEVDIGTEVRSRAGELKSLISALKTTKRSPGGPKVLRRLQRGWNPGKWPHEFVYKLLDSPPSWACVDLILITLNPMTVPKILRTEPQERWLSRSYTDHWVAHNWDRSK